MYRKKLSKILVFNFPHFTSSSVKSLKRAFSRENLGFDFTLCFFLWFISKRQCNDFTWFFESQQQLNQLNFSFIWGCLLPKKIAIRIHQKLKIEYPFYDMLATRENIDYVFLNHANVHTILQNLNFFGKEFTED